jgi:plasmid stabilization system protein ParE
VGKSSRSFSSYDRDRGRPVSFREDDTDDKARHIIPDAARAAKEYDRLLRKLTEGLAKETLSERQVDALHDRMDELWWDLSEEDQKRADDDATQYVREGTWPEDEKEK